MYFLFLVNVITFGAHLSCFSLYLCPLSEHHHPPPLDLYEYVLLMECFHLMLFNRILIFRSFSMLFYVLMIFECDQCYDSPLLWSARMLHAYALGMLSCHHYLILILLCFDLLESFFLVSYVLLCYLHLLLKCALLWECYPVMIACAH